MLTLLIHTKLHIKVCLTTLQLGMLFSHPNSRLMFIGMHPETEEVGVAPICLFIFGLCMHPGAIQELVATLVLFGFYLYKQ